MSVKLVLATVNRSYATPITAEKLTYYIKHSIWPTTVPDDEQMETLFSEVPAKSILVFCRQTGISTAELKSYYEKHIRPRFRNHELEAYFSEHGEF